MGVECVIVMAHAMGRTLVIPPQEHLYLLSTFMTPHFLIIFNLNNHF